ncbi:Conserved protein of uncharacterised function; putative phage protein [Mycobacteroides abscessus subsp. abscessus]|nr:Conserved protein of uncharacterised function; putative phage protein [Mycobacteroides abscessus subsp. abscessus]
MEVMKYTANVSRDGRWWLIHVPEIDQYSQARNLAEVESMARSLISVVLEVEPDSFDLAQRLELPLVASRHLELASNYRDQAANANARSAFEYRSAAKALKEEGLTVRDIGAALDVSFQRAQQLVSG